MERKIYAGIFGSGLGHVIRVYPIVEQLKKQGYEFLFSTFDEGFDFLSEKGESVYKSPSVDIKWNLAGGVSGKDTFLRFPATMVKFFRQVRFESELLSRYNPRVVLSDSRLSTNFAAKAMFYPVVTILNQVKILFPPRFRQDKFSRVLERIEGDMLGVFWSLSDEVLFPDLPPPFTIGEANVAGVDAAKKVVFTGFMIPRTEISAERLAKARSLLGLDGRPLVFIQISGPNPTKPAFIDAALGASGLLSRDYNVVISKGFPNGSPLPERLAGGVWVFDWCPLKDELFIMSDLLVARAGHTTISQCINFGKPSVLVPIYNHSEQLWNAEKFVRLQLGTEIKSEQLSRQTLVEAINSCLRETVFKSNAERLRLISEKYPGTETAIEVLKTYL